MKRFNAILFVLLILLSGITFGQYGRGSSEKYYREVGTALGTDSLNVNGLKKAIASLPDSGVVYIHYPGIWDTTGLGAIPEKVIIKGYLLGKEVGVYESDYSGIQIDSAAGHFLGNIYTAYVGGGESNFPLTVNGLADAIASLDSGTVIISYPGLWDTTGLGVLPNNISIEGWLFGTYKRVLSSNKKYTFEQILGQPPIYSLGGAVRFIGRHNSFDAFVSVEQYLDEYASYAQGQDYIPFMSITAVDDSYNDSIPNLGGIKNVFDIVPDSGGITKNNFQFRMIQNDLTYRVKYQPRKMDFIRGTSNDMWWGDYWGNVPADTVWANNIYHYHGNVFGIRTNQWMKTNYYGYYMSFPSNFGAQFLDGIKPFLFYGAGAYPSWFGGNANALGYNYGADTAATDAYKIALDGAHTLTAGLEVTFKAVTANTDGATLQVNSLTAKDLVKAATGAVTTALATGDILAGQIVKAVYDGTNFQVISRLAQ